MKYSPEQIVKENILFSIPIYQRLFEWDNENIKTLLDDLKREYETGKGDYFIGMITTVKSSERYDLVDGQQRFTVLMLMGCVLKNYDNNWKRFVKETSNRLRFASRPDDDLRLIQLIESENQKDIPILDTLTRGYDTINRYFNALEINIRKKFASYIYKHLSFFISTLPVNYKPQDLNRYFERMNSSGKNLENHEILKVKLLKRITCGVDKYMALWNRIADTNSVILKKRNGETDQEFNDRKKKALYSGIKYDCANGADNTEFIFDDNDIPSILEIEPSSDQPNISHKENENRCALSFSQLLLQVLYRKLNGHINGSLERFFDTNNLLDTFRNHLPFEGKNTNENDIIDFLNELYRCRLALDICFIRPKDYGYDLDMDLNFIEDEEDDDVQKEDKRKLLMIESLLFVSSSNYSNYRWFGWLMDSILNHKKDLSPKTLFEDLKMKDDELHRKLPLLNEITYGNDMRYWFWRLDFYIWYHRDEIFKGNSKALDVAEKYIFIRNRSLEHIAPQCPKSNSDMKWSDSIDDQIIRDSFGNLVMISQGLNSSLSNESFELKKAHVKSYMNGSKTGSIESLKLLVVHQDYLKWDKNSINEHGAKMYKWLEDSYN